MVLRPTRVPSTLSDSLRSGLNMYALSASAAGVGVLALAHPAEAKIIYTKAHHVIGHGQLAYPVDLDHDGRADLLLIHTSLHRSFGKAALFASPVGRNEVWGYNRLPSWYASALPAGESIGRSTNFIPRKLIMAIVATNTLYSFWGAWADGGKGIKNRYLGLRFDIRGESHYGWARLSVTVSRAPLRATATLTGYAYETVPNKGIIAGQTKGPDAVTVQPEAASNSLGRLALGRR